MWRAAGPILQKAVNACSIIQNTARRGSHIAASSWRLPLPRPRPRPRPRAVWSQSAMHTLGLDSVPNDEGVTQQQVETNITAEEEEEGQRSSVDGVVSLLRSSRSWEEEKSKTLNLDAAGLRAAQDRALEMEGLERTQICSFFRWLIRQPGYTPADDTVERVLECVSRNGGMELGLVRDFLKDMALIHTDSVSSSHLKTLINLLCISKRPAEALEVFRGFAPLLGCPDSLSMSSLASIAEALCSASLHDKAWALLTEKDGVLFSLEDEHLTKFLTLLSKAGKSTPAHSLYSKMTEMGMFPSFPSIHALVSSLASSKPEAAMEIVLAAVSRDAKSFGNKPSALSLLSIVKNLCNRGDTEYAWKSLSQLAKFGLKVDQSMYQPVIAHLCDAGKAQQALEWLQEIANKPPVEVYNVIMKSFQKAGKMDDAVKVFAIVKKRYSVVPRDCYGVMIEGFCKLKDLDRANEFALDLKKSGRSLTTNMYSQLITAYCHLAADWRTAQQLISEMKAKGISLATDCEELVYALKELEEELVQA